MGGWDTGDIPDQRGRVAIVTGANSGLGLVTARELARAGATVVLACRDAERGVAAVREVQHATGNRTAYLDQLDLADLASVRSFARAMATEYEAIDLLVNNAGIMAPPRAETADGFELQLGTNHLGHFALTGLLLERMRDVPGARVVTVSSTAHWIGRINFGDLQSERGYGRWRAYGQSKLANLLFAFELQRRLAAAEAELISVAAHPGYSATRLQSTGPGAGGLVGRALSSILSVGNRLAAQSDEMGALPLLYAATAPDIPGGAFVGPSSFDQMRGHPRLVGATGAARDEAAAARLWDISAELTGVDFAALERVPG